MDTPKSTEYSDLEKLIDKYSPFFNEAKKRIVLSVIVFFLASIIGFVFYEEIIKLLVGALSLQGVNIVFTSPFQFINLAFSCGIVSGLVFTLPFIIFQLLHFLHPALNGKEFSLVTKFIPFSLILFVIGFVFGAIIMKWQIGLFLNQSTTLGIGNILDISSLLSTVFITSAIMGLGFQFPIILLLLRRLDIIKRHHLINKRSWVYLGSLIFSFLLPPDSIIADVLLALPLIILFELTLIIDKIISKKTTA